MSYSLNEVQAMAKRAARGAGLDWGMAEEAAWAARWLCRAGLPGVEILSHLLVRRQSQDGTLATRDQSTIWTARQGDLSPLFAGPALSDSMVDLLHGPFRLQAVRQPLMLLPFASSAATQLDRVVALRWDGGEASVGQPGLCLTGTAPDLADVEVACLSPHRDTELHALTHTRADPDPAAWNRLGNLAHATYAPATEASRRLGAGAGLSDND